MRNTLALVVGLATVVGAFPVANAQSNASQLEGAWAIQEVTSPKPMPNPPEKPTGLVVFSGRHYAVSATDATRPDFAEGGPAKATAEQLRATWGPVQSEAGTFTVTGNTIRFTRVVAKGPAAMRPGNFVERSFMLKGDTLVVTDVRNQNGPAENPVTVRLTRAK
jgi:hypothetical protein